MILIIVGITVLVLLLIAFFTYLVAKLYVYILGLETKLTEAITKNDNMYESLKELVADDFLLKDGRLKKFRIDSDSNRMYNGVVVDEEESEI